MHITFAIVEELRGNASLLSYLLGTPAEAVEDYDDCYHHHHATEDYNNGPTCEGSNATWLEKGLEQCKLGLHTSGRST